MKTKKLKNIENRMLNIGTELNKLESLSRILCNCITDAENLKTWDVENLSIIMLNKLSFTKRKFNEIEVILKL